MSIRISPKGHPTGAYSAVVVGSNNMGQQLTPLKLQWSNCDRCSHHASFLGGVMLSSHLAQMIWAWATLSSGGIWRRNNSEIDHTIRKKLIYTFATKSLQCPWHVSKCSWKLQTSPSNACASIHLMCIPH